MWKFEPHLIKNRLGNEIANAYDRHMARLILFNKPFDVLSQFTDTKSPSPRPTLSAYIKTPDVYPAGRLDRDSEGLMLLTDNGPLQAFISSPKFKQEKTYLAQVEGTPTEADLQPLRDGITLKDGPCRPAKVKLIDPPIVWDRDPPVRFRKSVPDAWIELTISEGRNRQVRRMTAAIGFPTLRLIRWRIGDWSVEGIAPGQSREIEVPAPAPQPKPAAKKPFKSRRPRHKR